MLVACAATGIAAGSERAVRGQGSGNGLEGQDREGQGGGPFQGFQGQCPQGQASPRASRSNGTPLSKDGAPKEKDSVAKASAPKASAPKASAPKASAPKGSVPWYRPVRFGDLPGWERDDHLAAFQTFLKSCGRVIARGRESAAETDSKRPQVPPSALVAACTRATAQAGEITTKEAARAFFEDSFTPNAVAKKGQTGLLTGYYEPVLQGSRTPDGSYQTPIYKRPPDSGERC